MPHGGDDLSVTLASLPPEVRAALARRWVARAFRDHAPAALEAAGHHALAYRLSEVADDLDAAVRCGRQIEHALDHALVNARGESSAASLAWDAVCEALAAARLAGHAGTSPQKLLTLGEHTCRAEQLAIAAQRRPGTSGRIVLATERGRQAGEARTMMVA